MLVSILPVLYKIDLRGEVLYRRRGIIFVTYMYKLYSKQLFKKPSHLPPQNNANNTSLFSKKWDKCLLFTNALFLTRRLLNLRPLLANLHDQIITHPQILRATKGSLHHRLVLLLHQFSDSPNEESGNDVD